MGVSRDCPNFLSTPIISGTGKATKFTFGRDINRVDANKRPLKFGEKMEWGHIQGLPKFVEYSLLCQEQVTVSIQTKAHEKFGRKGIVVVSRDCPNF